jgi:hypothetical protein
MGQGFRGIHGGAHNDLNAVAFKKLLGAFTHSADNGHIGTLFMKPLGKTPGSWGGGFRISVLTIFPFMVSINANWSQCPKWELNLPSLTGTTSILPFWGFINNRKFRLGFGGCVFYPSSTERSWSPPFC